MFPYALLMAELGTAFPQEGGPYEWMKLTWGRLAAGIGAVLYWVTNPFWVGGSLCFIATDTWSSNIHGVGSGTVGDYAFKFIFIWISIGVAIVSLKHGKWIPNVGAIVRFVVLGFFSLTVVDLRDRARRARLRPRRLLAHGRGVHRPRAAADLRVRRLRAAERRGRGDGESAARRAPLRRQERQSSRSLAYAIPIFGIVAVLPSSKITGIGGFMDAVHQTFGVYGGAQNFLTDVMALGFIFALVTSGAVWMIGSDRIQAVAAYDGAFFPLVRRVQRQAGHPGAGERAVGRHLDASSWWPRCSLLSGSEANTFTVVLYMAISTTLVSYILIFPALIKLRYSHADVPRVFTRARRQCRPDGRSACSARCWVMLGSWVAIFPDTLEYAVRGTTTTSSTVWGVSRLRFEVFTLGTLAVVIAFA